MNTKLFADIVGRQALAKAVGVSTAAVTNAIERGTFPASWYEEGRRLALIHRIEAPPAMFNQKLAAE